MTYKCPHHTLDTDRPYTEDCYHCATCGDLISVKTGEPVIVENTVNVPKPRFLADDYEAIRNRLREIKGEPCPILPSPTVRMVTECKFWLPGTHKCGEASCVWRDTPAPTSNGICGKGGYPIS
jgi:hypothetical protein